GEYQLRPGMTANCTFVYADRKDAVRLPTSALRFHLPGAPAPAGRRRTVWILRDGRPAAVPVEIGVSDETSVEVVAGDLRGGEDVSTEAPAEPASRPQTPPGGGRRI